MLQRRSSEREVQRLGFRVEPDVFVFSLADWNAPPDAAGAEGAALRRLVLGRDAVTITAATPVLEVAPGLDGEDALTGADLEALRDDDFLDLSRLTAASADTFGPF